MRKTRRSFVTSFVALLLCISMLLGTTFAWFSDNATTAVQKVQAGTLKLDLALLDKETKEWTSIKDSQTPVFNYDKWEPGYMDVKVLKIENKGDLAFQWIAKFVSQENMSALADVIDVYVCKNVKGYPESRDLNGYSYMGSVASFINTINEAASGHLLKEESVTLGIALKMRESAGNAYQGLKLGDFDIQVMATQYAYEYDSNGNTYDQAAEFDYTIRSSEATTVVTPADGKVPEGGVTLQDGNVSAYVPEGVKLKDGVTELTLTITPLKTSTGDVSISNGEVAIPVDVHIEGIAEDNTVPIIITLGAVLPKYLNMGNYRLYHMENSTNNVMTLVSSTEELKAHNQFTYDSDTGVVTLAMATFSEVTLVANTGNPWSGDYSNADTEFKGSGTESDPYLITTADELAGMSVLISDNPETWGNKCYKLICDINIDGENGKVWYPVGYRKVGSGTNKAGKVWYTYGGSFSGVFDGAGHTVTGIVQNTWIMDGNYGNGNYKEAMGLFGHVDGGTIKNLTVDNFLGEGEYTPMGCVAASASGNAKFENIALTNCFAATYNTTVGGIVGWECGDSDNRSNLTFQNITIDSSNTISALWKTWDADAGGILGYLGEYGSANFVNCVLSPTLDVYNDVCGSYQYYQYRYTGMVIGAVDRLDADGNIALSDSRGTITATNCTVSFGDRHEYYYCEFEKNGKASYSGDYRFSRIDNSDLVTENSVVTGCTHDHTDAEDKQAVYLPFRNLFGGHGWGIKSVDEYEDIDIKTESTSSVKFAVKDGISNETILRVGNSNAFPIGTLFEAVSDAEINTSGVYVSATSVIDGTEITGTFTLNSSDWTKSTLKLNGTGIAKITIQDYNLCTPTTMYVEVVDAYNVTDASGLGNKNMVLLNDVTFAKNLDIAGNNTLYGNGFTLDCSAYTPNAGRFGVIILNNGNLDNVKIIGQPFSTFTNTSSEQYYAATVHVYGTSKISNSYIANCQVPVRVAAGADCTLDNTTLYGGRYANMEIKGGNVVLKNVTTVQEKVTINGTTCLGMGIMVWQDTESLTLKVEGSLTQYNWACEADKNYLPSAASSYASQVFSDSTFADIRHSYNGTDYVNFGIFNISSKVDTDALIGMPSDYTQVKYSKFGTNAWIATYSKSKNSSALANGVPGYSGTTGSEQGILTPTFTWSYPEEYNAANNTISTTFEQDESYTLDPNILTAKKYGNVLDVTVTMDGVDYTGKTITFTESGEHSLTFTVSDPYNYNTALENQTLVYTFTVPVKVTEKTPDTKNAVFTYTDGTATKIVEINGKKYIMPDVSGTGDSIASVTVNGTTVYMPIVSAIYKNNSSDFNAYTPLFTVINITDYEGGLVTGAATTYSTSTKTLPSGWSLVSGNPYIQGAASTTADPKTYSSYGLCYECKKGSDLTEQNHQVCFCYTDNAGETYYYYIQYKFEDHTCPTNCVTPDTLITLADGTQKRVDELNFDDQILVWDFFKGTYAKKDISILINHGSDLYQVVYLTYSDGTVLKLIGEHGVFDYDLNRYVYITAENADDYIGHRFVKQGKNGKYKVTKLTSAYVKEEYTEAWSLSSAETSNAFASGLLTVAPPDDFYNWISMDGKLHYDNDQFAKDVETYGLYSYEDFAEYVTYEQYLAFNGAYLKIPVEKGIFTFEYILELIAMYSQWMS